MGGEVVPEGEEGKGREGAEHRAREQLDGPVLGALPMQEGMDERPDKFDSVERTADFDRESETRSATGPMRRT